MRERSSSQYHKFLLEKSESLGLFLSDQQAERLLRYAELVHRWNRTYNLTAVRNFEAVLNRHILDSLSMVRYVEDDKRVLDVGSGAGLPGIPLALVRSDLKVALLDSNGRKASFLRQVISDLKIVNAGVVNDRVESFVPKEKFDVVVARAFSSLDNLIRMTHHLYKEDGYLLAMKGMYPSAELAEIAVEHEIYNLKVPGDAAERHLVMIEVNAIHAKQKED
jgi:16S rRNA (guanine527-N7)-methyltransferase